MKQALKLAAVPAVLLCLALVLTGCPKVPPFNATGNYSGTWSGTIETKAVYTVEDCPLSIELFHPAEIPSLNFQVVGLLTVNWGCILPQDVLDLLGLQPQNVSVPILAKMGEDGALTLKAEIDLNDIPPELLILLNIDEIDNIPLDNFVFELDSTGVDSNDDGIMDSLTGNLSISANYQRNSAQETVTVAGKVQVQRVP